MERDVNNLIKVLDFTEYPGPRYNEQGKNSGEDFYHLMLNESFANSLRDNKSLTVDLDRTAGYASSFLDEAFGNLVFDFTLDVVKNNLKIISNQEKDWIIMIFDKVLVDWETRRLENSIPKKTTEHSPWFRYINSKLEKDKWL